jgi:hypothetical protein
MKKLRLPTGRKAWTWLWKVTLTVIIGIVIGCSLTINSVTQPASVAGGATLPITLNATITANATQSSALVIGCAGTHALERLRQYDDDFHEWCHHRPATHDPHPGGYPFAQRRRSQLADRPAEYHRTCRQPDPGIRMDRLPIQRSIYRQQRRQHRRCGHHPDQGPYQ